MITRYPRPVEEAMRYTFSTLNERQRRLFAASEALKLGHGGIVYIAQLLNCHRRTVERGLNELRHPDLLLPPHRARKKGVAAKAVWRFFQGSTTPFCKSLIPTRRAIPTKTVFFGPTFRGPRLRRNFCDEAFA
jgi:hypothetical protein